MKMGERIQRLRKAKGISQEELAACIGVSRQAVSKWESCAAVPDLDKTILLCDYFQVTADYLLRGVEPTAPLTEEEPRLKGKGNPGLIVSTVMNFMGVVISCAVWYEKQTAAALVAGLIFLALGCMVYGIGLSEPHAGSAYRRRFWRVNIWMVAFIPLSALYNLIFVGFPAPYPLLGALPAAFILFWILYAILCLSVLIFQNHAKR